VRETQKAPNNMLNLLEIKQAKTPGNEKCLQLEFESVNGINSTKF